MCGVTREDYGGKESIRRPRVRHQVEGHPISAGLASRDDFFDHVS